MSGFTYPWALAHCVHGDPRPLALAFLPGGHCPGPFSEGPTCQLGTAGRSEDPDHDCPSQPWKNLHVTVQHWVGSGV